MTTLTKLVTWQVCGWGGDGGIGSIPILIGSFGFPEHISSENLFFATQKLTKHVRNHYVGLFPLQEGWGCGDGLDIDLEWLIRVSQTHFVWNFFSETRKMAKYMRNHYEALFIHTGWGVERSGTSRSSVIHSGFANMFQIKNFFRNSKTRKVRKNLKGVLSPQKRQWSFAWLDPDIEGLIPVSYTHLTLPTIYSV